MRIDACTVQPRSASLTGSAPVPIQSERNNDGRWKRGLHATSRHPTRRANGPPLGKVLLALLVLMTLWTVAATRRLRRGVRRVQAVAMTMLLAVSLAACFGGGGSNTVAGTPTGTYVLTITASSGTATRTLPLTLIVQ